MPEAASGTCKICGATVLGFMWGMHIEDHAQAGELAALDAPSEVPHD